MFFNLNELECTSGQEGGGIGEEERGEGDCESFFVLMPVNVFQ